MASKTQKVVGYIPTSVSSKMKSNGNTTYKSGAVIKNYNLRDQGYPDSRGVSTGTMVKTSTPKATSTPRYSAPSYSTPSYSESSYSEPSYDYDYEAEERQRQADSYNALIAAYEAKQRQYDEYLRQRKEAAQNAYNKGMSSLNDAYNSQMSSLGNNLSDTKNQLLGQYNRSKTSINNDAENSLRQAYINRMMSEKNLGQQMSALGLNGGATETTLAGMLNNYGNARNAINTTTNNNLSNLEGNYSSNLSQAQQAYNSAVASANAQKAQQIMALENALANSESSALVDYQNLLQRSDQNYLDLLKSAIANGASFKYDPTAANNQIQAVAYNPISNNPALLNNYAAIKQLMDSAQNAPGTSAPQVLSTNPVDSNNYLAAILQQLRG